MNKNTSILEKKADSKVFDRIDIQVEIMPMPFDEISSLSPSESSVAMARLDMSARAYDRILKVARTIADLDGSATVCATHIREAISYRNLDRSTWGSTTGNLPF